MSDDGNVWSPGDEAHGERRPRPAGTAYGEGLWLNQAFSLDVAFRLGIALVRERPGLLLGVATAYWLLSNLPNFLSIPGGMASGFLEAGGDIEAAALVDVFNNLGSLGLAIVLFPFQWAIMTGGLRAASRYVENDDADPSIVWSSGIAAAWVILYRILTVFLTGLLLILAFIPVVLLAGAIAWGGQVEAALVVGGIGFVVVGLAWLIGVALPVELGTLACAIDGASPIDALGIAWRASQGARATLFVFVLVFTLLMVLGVCFCCVGQIPVYALAIGAVAGGWTLYSRPEDVLQRSPFLRRNLPDLT